MYEVIIIVTTLKPKLNSKRGRFGKRKLIVVKHITKWEVESDE